jgi:hypothetical protein
VNRGLRFQINQFENQPCKFRSERGRRVRPCVAPKPDGWYRCTKNRLNLKFGAFLRKRAGRRIAPKTEVFSCRFCVRVLEIRGQITASKKLLVKVQRCWRSLKPTDAGSTGILRPKTRTVKILLCCKQ